jgi:hypothetical protein
MKLQLTTLATAQQLAIMTARFHSLAAPELNQELTKQLNQQLEANLKARLEALTNTARVRVRDRRFLSETAAKAFHAEMVRLRQRMVIGSKAPNWAIFGEWKREWGMSFVTSKKAFPIEMLNHPLTQKVLPLLAVPY